MKKLNLIVLSVGFSSLLLSGCSNNSTINLSNSSDSSESVLEIPSSYKKFSSSDNYLNSLTPSDTFLNDYELNWNLYKPSSSSILLSDEKGSIYSNDENTDYYGISIGDSKDSVLSKLGEPLKNIEKSNNLYDIQSDEFFTFDINDNYVTYFFDNIQGSVVKSVLVVPKSIEIQKPGYFSSNVNESYISSLEDLMVVLINTDRVKNGLPELIYDKSLNATAKKHSQDMIDNNYFAHDNLKGESVKDRMENDGFVGLSLYGENIAYGQFNSIYAHEALMNSEGHRKNILEKIYTHVGVGVSLKDDGVPYFTINFYSE